jgi:hypothetical protein
MGIPEANMPVSGTTTSGEKAVLMRTPGDGLDGSGMITEFY